MRVVDLAGHKRYGTKDYQSAGEIECEWKVQHLLSSTNQ
jgi:hypothetical protein